MCKKLINTFIFTFLFLIIFTCPAKALLCTIEGNPDQTASTENPNVHGLVDWWNARLIKNGVQETDKDRYERQKKELSKLTLICNYSNYTDTSSFSQHVEIYKDTDPSAGNQYFIVRRQQNNGVEEEIRMFYCYNQKPDSQRSNGIDLPSVDPEYYDDYQQQVHYFGDGEVDETSEARSGISSSLNSNICPAYAGITGYEIDGINLTALVFGTKSLAYDYPAGTCSGVAEGFSCNAGMTKEGDIVKIDPVEKYVPKTNNKEKKTYIVKTEKYEKNVCNMVSTLRFLRVARIFLQIGRIMVPLILIIMLTVDVYKCMIVNAGDFAKIKNKVIIRSSIALAIFFIPTIINVLVNLAPNNNDKPFHYCKVCFFGDEFNSLRECEDIIANSSKYVYDTQYDVSGVEDKCTDNAKNGYNEALKKECGIDDKSSKYSTCASKFKSEHKPYDYYNTCRCSDKDFNGYNYDLKKACDSQQNNSTAYNECVKGFKRQGKAEKEHYDDCIARFN